MEIVEIQGGIGKGIKMMLNLRRERHYFSGIHEVEVQSLLSDFVRPGMTVYNIGAHIGFFALLLKNLVRPGGKVIIFEPNPQVRERLMHNLSLNRAGNCIRIEDWALNDFDGNTDFSLGFSDTQGRFIDLPGAEPRQVIRVGCKRLDTYVDEGAEAPDFILMDVEHAEGRVFRGMARILKKYKPTIVVEMHGPASIKEAWNELKKCNYSLISLPALKVADSLETVAYGHYLAMPINNLS
jgi:FkbM family methyltransferase